MKRLMLAVWAGLVAVAVATPSFAADLPRPIFKAPAANPIYVPPFSWTGLYVGINGGYGWGKTSWTTPAGTTGDFNVKGGLVGGTLGYNMQFGSIVGGIETDVDASWIKGTNDPCGPCETRNNWLATARGRVGYAWDKFLPYLTGGAAFGNIKSNFAGGSDNNTKVGWTAGAGVEWAFMSEWSVKAEYLYVDLGSATCGVAVCGVDTDVSFRKVNIGRVGLNYRF
jgi:outer membrane immunogenic protein